MRRAVVTTAAVTCGTPAIAEPLHLMCVGGGRANQATSSQTYVAGSNGASAWGTTNGIRSVPFDDRVNVEIYDDEGRIRLPRTMLPTIRGGKDGWFELENLKVTENEITGSAAVNVINSPKVRIDRLTGRISIAGKAGSYSGECQAYDPATTQRRF